MAIGSSTRGSAVGALSHPYKNQPTQPSHLPPSNAFFGYQVAQVDATSQTAAIAATLFYTSATSQYGLYRATYYASVVGAAATSSTLGSFQIVYVDADSGSAATTTASPTNTGNAIGAMIGGTVTLNAAGGSAMSYQMGYTASGTMTYGLHFTLEYVNNNQVLTGAI